MFSRWRQENFFRYMRHRLALDALDSYAKDHDDLDRTVPNPATRTAAAAVRVAKAGVAGAEAAVCRDALDNGSAGTRSVDAARQELERRSDAAKAFPARVPLGELHPGAMRMDNERKRIHDAVRMSVYNAASALARLLAPHYARAEDEARTLLTEAFRSPADFEVVGDEMHVRINPLSAPRRSRAIEGLCWELNATETLYPGTKFRLVYSVRAPLPG